MSKQLLIYERAVPISLERHGQTFLEAMGNYSFAKAVNSVPLIVSEFVMAAREYPIVFAGEGDSIMPAGVLGLRQGENSYVGEDGSWKGRYVPAFLRRYPFVFARLDDGDRLTLCIDEDFDGVNSEGRGRPLFGEDGKPSEFLDQVVEFSKEYQRHYKITQAFCKGLKELDLLEPAKARFRTPDGQESSLAGFMTISREKLKALDGEMLARMAKADTLELCYLHLHSLANLDPVARQTAERIGGELEEAAAPRH